jgi:two-component system KDP operon response regulator KdpE
LIVEDAPEIRRFVRQALEAEGFRVCEAETQRQGLVEAATRQPDLMLLDLGLPDGDGMELIRGFRAYSRKPVLVLSARSEENDKVAALDAGADDFLTKPFGVLELLARVRAALRRAAGDGLSGSEAAALHVLFGDVDIDLGARKVRKAGKTLHLTPVEYRLLQALIRHPGKVLTHRHLLKEVWGPTYVEHSHYLRIYMGHLRQKLEDEPARPRHLLTETGVGYRFEKGGDGG